MGDVDHMKDAGGRAASDVVGSPFDNASVAARLGGETFTTQVGDLVFDGFRVTGAGSVADGTGASGAGAVTAAAADGTSGTESTTASGAGESADGDRPVAVLVHGWPQFAACWEETARALVDAGIDVIAYDQRGYSPGARPGEVEDYTVELLVADLHALVRAWGLTRFHLVGHDWGGILGWHYAAQHPDDLLTFTSVSTAHPTAHGLRIEEDPDQYERMHYLRQIRKDPAGVEARMLADGGRRLAAIYGDAVSPERVQSYVDRFSEPEVLAAALAYYRALGLGHTPQLTPITVPTLYVWGSEDLAFTRGAAELTGDHVEADYRFVEIPDATHWLPEQEPEVVSGAVIDWIREH